MEGRWTVPGSVDTLAAAIHTEVDLAGLAMTDRFGRKPVSASKTSEP